MNSNLIVQLLEFKHVNVKNLITFIFLRFIKNEALCFILFLMWRYFRSIIILIFLHFQQNYKFSFILFPMYHFFKALSYLYVYVFKRVVKLFPSFYIWYVIIFRLIFLIMKHPLHEFQAPKMSWYNYIFFTGIKMKVFNSFNW